MRLRTCERERLAAIPYQAAGRGRVENVQLVVDRLLVDALPDGCQALLIAGDLQGIAPSPLGGDPALLGIVLADYLHVWAAYGLLPPPERVGVLLTGDLYSAPSADQRGASGDVTDVWLAFAAAGCPMVIGIAGNHDEVTATQLAGLAPGMVLLDGSSHRFGGLTFAGVGGVVGDPARPMRRTEKDFLALVEAAATPWPDVLLLHEGPAGNASRQPGNVAVRASLERRPPALTVCGHVHWDEPVASLGDGHVVNVDARAMILCR